MGRIVAGVGVIASLLVARSAAAFCGFYVAGADSKLFAEASQVVLMRDGTRTVLSMQNDYKGPLSDFAMVVPVPVVLQKENVKTLPKDVFARVDKLGSPRLVEYWERDPCAPEGIGLGNIGTLGHGSGQGFGSGAGRLGGAAVKIEAQFEVGEYDVVILSAQDAAGLEQWLEEHHYKIPDGSEPFFRPYVQAGSKFFVAKVNANKVKMEDGVATLSPLRFHYDSEKFELPVRLGLVNSSGKQDLIVNILAENKRYEVANYPNVTIPTNLDVAESARGSFGEVYAALFDKTIDENPKAIVTEYSWPASSCDPCPGGGAGLSINDVITLGADVLPSRAVVTEPTRSNAPVAVGSTVRAGAIQVDGPLPSEIVQRIVRQNFGRFRICHEAGLMNNPNVQGKVTTKLTIGKKGEVSSVSDGGFDLPDKLVADCVHKQFENLSFPESEKPSLVTYTLHFMPGPANVGRGGGALGSAPSFVLTRLHARYGKDSLGADLVFKEAPAIVGGRELVNETGKLETGVTKSGVNSFQARYAIRHSWPGKIECANPKRGVWGGPWPDADAGAFGRQTIGATKTAYAPRGRVDVSRIFGSASLAAVPISDSAQTPDAGTGGGASAAGGDGGAAAPANASKCGCRTPGSDAPIGGGAFVGLAFAASALLRRVCSRAR